MITFKGNEERLREINPYFRWKEFDIELVATRQIKMNLYKEIYATIPFERMKFGDSVFIPVHPNYWHKIKRFFRHNPTIRIMYEKEPQKFGGIRVWRWTVPEPKLRRPKRRLKLAA